MVAAGCGVELCYRLLQQHVGGCHIRLRHLQRCVLPHHECLLAHLYGGGVAVAQQCDGVERGTIVATLVERMYACEHFACLLIVGLGARSERQGD